MRRLRILANNRARSFRRGFFFRFFSVSFIFYRSYRELGAQLHLRPTVWETSLHNVSGCSEESPKKVPERAEFSSLLIFPHIDNPGKLASKLKKKRFRKEEMSKKTEKESKEKGGLGSQ